MLIKSTLFRWSLKFFFSVGDQVVVSTANFLLNINLANVLSTDTYGAFAFGFSVFLFLSGFNNALVLEPFTIFGSAYPENEFFPYFSTVLFISVLVNTGLALLGGILALIISIYSIAIANGILGASLSAPFILTFWLFRRVCYVRNRPQVAFTGSTIYAMALLALVLLTPGLTLLVSFIWLGISSLIGSIAIFIILWFTDNLRLTKAENFKGVMSQNWQYGKWVVGSAFVYWIGSNVTIPAIGGIIGLKELGIFRQTQNFILPLQQIGAALGSLYLPWLSRKQNSSTPKMFLKATSNLMLGQLLGGVGYFLLLYFLGSAMLRIVYGEISPIAEPLLLILGLFALLDFVAGGMGNILRVLKNSAGVFRSQAWGALFSVTVQLFLINKYGLLGAGYGLLITVVVIFIVLVFENFKSIQKQLLMQNIKRD